MTEDQIKEMLPAIGDRIQLIELLKESPASSLHGNATPRAEATVCTSQCHVMPRSEERERERNVSHFTHSIY